MDLARFSLLHGQYSVVSLSLSLVAASLTVFQHFLLTGTSPKSCLGATSDFNEVFKKCQIFVDNRMPLQGVYLAYQLRYLTQCVDFILKSTMKNVRKHSPIHLGTISSHHPVTRILARLPRCMGMLAKILARSCQDLTKATMIMQDHGKADHASYQAYQDFPCILPSFSMCLAKHTKIFLSILPIQPGFFHAFCKAFQDFRCNLQSLIRSTCVFEPFEILY